MDAARLKWRLFGSGSTSLYRLGSNESMHGTPVARWPRLPSAGTRAVLDQAGSYAHVRRSSGFVPVKVMGGLSGPGSGKAGSIAIAVNGTIAATAPTVSPRRGTQYFSAIVSEDSLHEGSNKIELFAIVRTAGGPALRPLLR